LWTHHFVPQPGHPTGTHDYYASCFFFEHRVDSYSPTSRISVRCASPTLPS
jgi:hypothetical protein